MSICDDLRAQRTAVAADIATTETDLDGAIAELKQDPLNKVLDKEVARLRQELAALRVQLAGVDRQIATQCSPTPQPSALWTSSQLAAAGAVPAAARVTAIAKPAGCELWWIGTDGAVNGVWSEPGSAWASYQLATPGAAVPGSGITAVSKGGDAMEVWWIGPDGSVQAAWHDSGWARYTLAGPGSASLACRITSAYGGSLMANVMRVWWVDAAGATYQAFFDSEWSVSPIGAGADPSGATAGILFNPDTPTVFWARPDGSLVDAYPPEISLSAPVSGGRGLKGTVWLTLREDGSTRWHGDVTNDEVYGYDFALSVYAPTGTSADIGAAHHGHVAGSLERGSSNDIWDEEHEPNRALAGALAAYRFSQLSLKLEHSVDLVDYLKAAIDAIFEMATAIAVIEYGAVVLIGVEIGSLLETGSLVPGAIIAGGVPWLTGPGGIFVRALVTASNGEGRQLTDEEYAWANEMVFRGALPQIDSFRITNYLGADNLPFTFPTFAGPTLVNVGDAIYADIHVSTGADPAHQGEPTIIHELTHVCQIAHSHDVVFTATAIATQLKNRLFADVYAYGAAGFDYTSLGIEAQAEVVEDWFLGHPARPRNPEPTNHTHRPMDAQSPYYRYITDNLRVGRF